MKIKIFIGIIVFLLIILFVESAYLLQLKYDKCNQEENSVRLKTYKHLYDFDKEFFQSSFNDIEKTHNRLDFLMREAFRRNFSHELFNEQLDLSKKENIAETDKDYIIALDLPGMEESKITIEAMDDSLIISGTENSNIKKKGKNGFYFQENKYGSFQRIIPLPDNVDISSATTEYKNGILIIRLPKNNKQEKIKV